MIEIGRKTNQTPLTSILRLIKDSVSADKVL